MPVNIPTLSVAPSTIVARLASGDLLDQTPLAVRSLMFDGVPIAPTTIAAGDLVLVQDLDNSLALRTVTTQSIADLIGAGDVQGPASAIDNAIARYNGVTGKLIKNSLNSTINDNSHFKLIGSNAAIDMVERATGPSFQAGRGHLWVKNDVPSTLYFTDDVGGEFLLLPAASSANEIINGNFNIWQRGSTFTAPVDVYTADRWAWRSVGGGVVDILRSSDVPNGQSKFSLHVDVTTADAALAGADFYGIEYRIEGFDAQKFGLGTVDAGPITVSFLAKSGVTGIHSVAFQNSAIDRSYVAEYTIAVADTWEAHSVTITGDTAGNWMVDQSIGLAVLFAMASGPDRDTTPDSWQAGDFKASVNQVNMMGNVANNFKISQVKVDASNVATPFSDLPFGDELARAKRYYQKTFPFDTTPVSNAGQEGALQYSAFVAAIVANRYVWNFPVQLRVQPVTETFYNPGAAGSNWFNATQAINSGVSAAQGVTNDSRVMIFNAQAVLDAVGDLMQLHATVEAEL